jgi:NodT family efflux transporter outer membrane factor (OMF) lipoprotein
VPPCRPATQFSSVLLLLLISGCAAVGPDFERPPVRSPQSWSEAHAGAADLASGIEAGTPSAWTQVNDPVLQELFALADAANPDIVASAIRFAQARAQRGITGAQAGPQVNAGASEPRQRQSAYGASTRILEALGGSNQESLRKFLSSPFDSYDAGFDFSWELDLWGRVRRSLESADASVRRQEALHRQARLAIRAEVARAYVDLRSAQAQLRLARDVVQRVESSLKLVDARSRSGLVPEVDAVQQRGFVAEQRTRIPKLLQQEAASLNQLTLLCGELPGALNDKVAAAQRTLLDAGTPALDIGIPSELAARRPDVQAAMEELHAATADVGVAVGDLYPRIRLGASAGFESLTASRFGDWATRRWSVGPSLELPIFDGGRRRTVVRLRELGQQEAAVKFQRAVLAAWHEVDNAVSQYNAEMLSHADMLERLQSARTSLQIADQRYLHGLTSFVPVLDAQRTAAEVESAYAQHQARLWAYWLAVLKSIGSEIERRPG